MSILRPKDGDYIVRGLFLLIGWSVFGWIPVAVVGGLLGGAGGAAVGLLSSLIIIGPFGYFRYLKLDPKVYPQRTKTCACGHPDYIHRFNWECRDGQISDTTFNPLLDRYVTVRHGGCQCPKFKQQRWWRTNAQDPNDWSG